MIAAVCAFVCVFLLLAPLSKCAGPDAPKPPLTVLMDFESPHSEESLQALRQNLYLLLTPAGIDLDVELKEDLPAHAQFGELVVFSMKGSCTMNPPRQKSGVGKSGPLALAYTSDGQVLHFGEVECDRVRFALQRLLGIGVSRKNQEKYGAALAIVIAHEVYHMLGNATQHTHDGLTKAALSADELADPNLKFPPGAIYAVHAPH